MSEPSDRITFHAGQCGGRPCIRGMRIRVTDILDLLAAGLSFEEILEEMPDLEHEDIVASIRYATNSRLGVAGNTPYQRPPSQDPRGKLSMAWRWAASWASAGHRLITPNVNCLKAAVPIATLTIAVHSSATADRLSLYAASLSSRSRRNAASFVRRASSSRTLRSAASVRGSASRRLWRRRRWPRGSVPRRHCAARAAPVPTAPPCAPRPPASEHKPGAPHGAGVGRRRELDILAVFEAGTIIDGPTRTSALAFDPCLAQDPLDGGVVDAELGGDGAHPPVLDDARARRERRTRRSMTRTVPRTADRVPPSSLEASPVGVQAQRRPPELFSPLPAGAGA